MARSAIHSLLGESPVKGFQSFDQYFEGRKGLEIGGPSGVFSKKSILPVYAIAGSLDNCNFSSLTVWEGEVKAGLTFRYSDKGVGRQFVCEGSDLGFLPEGSYDFVLSSHAIEHMANPLKALHEWRRVLKEGGVLLLCAPEKEKTFDHRRPTTGLDHIVEDFNRNVDEHDLTHLPEILELHDLTMDPDAGTLGEFTERSAKNYENRCIHHHVFTMESLTGLLRHAGFEILLVTTHPPYHIVILGRSTR